MQQATAKQLFQQSLEDIQKTDGYLQRAQAHANRQAHHWMICYSRSTLIFFWYFPLDRQGGLDLQYLSQRYEKGKEWTKNFMETHQIYESTDVGGLSDLHARLLQYQSQLGDGGDSLLGFIGKLMEAVFLCAQLNHVLSWLRLKKFKKKWLLLEHHWGLRSWSWTHRFGQLASWLCAWSFGSDTGALFPDCSGPPQVNEACESAKSIAAANANAALLTLYPCTHTSSEKKVFMDYRRHIEDRLIQCPCLAVWDSRISLFLSVLCEKYIQNGLIF